jgi:tetratricopeptide (TPR) repeat protein
MNRREPGAVAGQSGTDPDQRARISPAALHEAALKHLQTGRDLEAQLCCQQALGIDPTHTDSLHLMGVLSLRKQHYDHAVEWFSRAIRQEPRPQYLASLGLALKLAGRLDEALAVIDKAVQLRPDDAALWHQLGGVLMAMHRNSDALATYQHVLTLSPRHWEAAYLCGVLLHEAERFEEALDHLNRSNEWQADNVSVLSARGRTLRALKRYKESLADYRRAQRQTPDDPIICNNVGDALLHLNRCEEALKWFEKALRLRPDFVEILANRAMALLHLARFDEAILAYRRVLALDPDNARSAWQIAHLQLLAGNFEKGWEGREARWRVPDFSPDYPKLSQPKWLGKEPIDGKTLLVCVDEGLGDALQFARYMPLLAARGAKVTLMVDEALRPLMSNVRGVSECLSFGAPLPPFDLHCPLMSLPLALGTTLDSIPPETYLPPIPPARIQAWQDRLSSHKRLRVGLVWSGNPHQLNDHNRSMSFATLEPLLDLDATFVSLQKGIRPEDKVRLDARTDVLDVTADLTDFVETAALISCLDLVVTVCTSVAHLSGTLGRPTWVLLPYIGDWRWLTGRDDSPWYPSVRLFRQNDLRSYDVVVRRVRKELSAMISSFRRQEGQQ